MERLDKIICNQKGFSRKQIKEIVRKGRVSVNGKVVLKSDIKVDPEVDNIILDGIEVKIKRNVYLMLNKPKGYISATFDCSMATVLDLVPDEYKHRNLFPAGRLDKDTTGLMIITDDGDFAHNILSPQKHVRKTYYVIIDIPLTVDMVTEFKKGIVLNDGECKSADLKIISEYEAIVVLTEGRYHQIKRMFGCFGGKVVELQRIGIGNFDLPDDLEIGECREFSFDELKKINE